MFESKLFKKYFPLQSPSSLYDMPREDQGKLVNLLRRIKNDLDAWNFRANIQGYTRQIICLYPEDISSLADKIESLSISEINNDDLSFINDVIFIYKFGLFNPYSIRGM